MWSGIYIDDWLLVRRLLNREARASGTDTERSEAVSKQYVETGLPEETTKSFNQELNFKAWGASIEGGIGHVGAPIFTRVQLYKVCCALCVLGVVIEEVTTADLGCFTSIFEFSRPCFSLFQYVYRFVEDAPDKVWFKVPAFVLDEFRGQFWYYRLRLQMLRTFTTYMGY